jgi:hypothetical protein
VVRQTMNKFLTVNRFYFISLTLWRLTFESGTSVFFLQQPCISLSSVFNRRLLKENNKDDDTGRLVTKETQSLPASSSFD